MKPLNVLALIKTNNRGYVFLFDDTPESEVALQQTFGRYAASTKPEYAGFTWNGAAVLSREAKKIKEERERRKDELGIE